MFLSFILPWIRFYRLFIVFVSLLLGADYEFFLNILISNSLYLNLKVQCMIVDDYTYKIVTTEAQKLFPRCTKYYCTNFEILYLPNSYLLFIYSLNILFVVFHIFNFSICFKNRHRTITQLILNQANLLLLSNVLSISNFLSWEVGNIFQEGLALLNVFLDYVTK